MTRMYRQHVYSLLIALLLICMVAFSESLSHVSAQEHASGSIADRNASFRAAWPPAQQPTIVARPTLDPTRLPLTTQPLATIRAELTATAQQATARALTPTAQPTPTRDRAATTAVPSPDHVPVVGQTEPASGGLIVLSLALFCFIVGAGFVFLSSRYRDLR